VSRYQKGKTNLDFTEARDSEWHQLGHMQVCTSLQADNHASTPPLSFFTGRMPFLPPNSVKALKAYGLKVKTEKILFTGHKQQKRKVKKMCVDIAGEYVEK